MKNLLYIVFACLLALGIAGCGGGGNGDGGGDGGGDTLIDNQLAAVWQAISVTEGGAIVPIKSALGWQSGITKQTIEFFETGQILRRSYTGATLTLTENGSGTAESQAGTMTFGSNVTNFNYMAYWDGGEPWILDLTYAKDTHNYVARYVKVVPLTAHHQDLLRTYKMSTADSPSPISVDGSSVSVADFFSMTAGSDMMTFQYLADGTLIKRELLGNLVVKRELGTWSSGGGTLLREFNGITVRGFFDAEGWTTTFLNEVSGTTVKAAWGRWGNLGSHPAELLGKWQPTEATYDSAPLSLADYFGWDADVTSIVTEFWNDGSVESISYKGTTPYETEFGSWGVNCSIILIGLVDDIVANYSLTGSSVTMSLNDAGHIYTVTFVKI